MEPLPDHSMYASNLDEIWRAFWKAHSTFTCQISIQEDSSFVSCFCFNWPFHPNVHWVWIRWSWVTCHRSVSGLMIFFNAILVAQVLGHVGTHSHIRLTIPAWFIRDWIVHVIPETKTQISWDWLHLGACPFGSVSGIPPSLTPLIFMTIGYNVKTQSLLWALLSEVTQNSQFSSNSNAVWGAYVQCGFTFMEPVSSHLGHKNFLGFCQILSNSFPTTQNPWYLGIGFTLAALLLAVYQEDHQAWPLRFSDTLVTLVLIIGHNVKTPSPLWALQSEVTQNSQFSSNSNSVWGAYVQCGCTFMEPVSSHSGHKNVLGFCQIFSNSFPTTQNPWYLGIGFTLAALLLAVYQEDHQAWPLRFSDT